MNLHTVPGFYAEIEDYQLNTTETVNALKENAILFFGDLPDFVYLPDETSSDVNAVKRIRIPANTVIPVTNTAELVKVLNGQNILNGILTQEQINELHCKDMINVIKMSEQAALRGEIAVVKIVKRDGTRPDINNKFEVYQALENAYEKLGSVKASQIVPIGISGDEDFVSSDDKKPTVVIKQSKEQGAVALDKIFNDVYSFSPVEKRNNIKLELAFEHPEYLDYTKDGVAENKLIKTEGIDSKKVKHLLTGKVLVDQEVVKTGLQLEFAEDKLVLAEEVTVEVVKGEMNAVIGKGTVFATLKTKDEGGKKVADLTAEDKPLLNYYEATVVKAEVLSFNAEKLTCKANEEITFTGKLKESVTDFAAKLEGTNFTLTEDVKLQSDGITFTMKGKFTAENASSEVTLKVEEPFVSTQKKLTINVSGTLSRAKAETLAVTPRSVSKVMTPGANQHVLIDIEKPSSNWIQITNLGNVKDVVDKIAILEGKKDGIEQYTVTKSGTAVIEFVDSKVLGEVDAVVVDSAEILEPRHYKIRTKTSGKDLVVAETTYLEWEGMTFVLYEGLVIFPEKQDMALVSSVYFDAKSDLVGVYKYAINYVPANAEPIMASLKFVNEQVKAFSEVLMVWGVKPPKSAEPDVVEKYAKNLVNLPKFKRGFKVRTSATKEVDYGMFLSVVAGTLKLNGIGGISNFKSNRVIDFEREQGGIGEVKPMTDKVFVELTSDYQTGSNVEIKTYVGVKQKVVDAVVLSVKEVLGKTMLTLNKQIDTSVFSLDGFEVIICNTDTKDRHGSYSAAAFAIKANEERDRAPIQKELTGIADFSFSQNALKLLLSNKFTVINKDYTSGNAVIVDTPLMTRKDSDYQSRSSIGTVLVMLNALRKVANSKKGKRFPKKEDKVMLEDELRSVFVGELNRADSLITSYEFATDMSKLDTKGYLYTRFRVRDAKKLEVSEFSGGLAKLLS